LLDSLLQENKMKRARYDPLESPDKDTNYTLNVSAGSLSSPELGSKSDGESVSPNKEDWQRLLQKSEKYESTVKNRLVINDSIHGHIQVPELCRALIDTPQFNRLRGLNQLGVAHYVYPGAKHSRFEHSIGVMHLAGEFINELQKKYPDCSDDKDKLCVQIAGLCHDLGHGPYSHLWEAFVHEAIPESTWSHEKASIDMFDFLIQDNNLMPLFEQNALVEKDLVFIKELIFGPMGENGEYAGRNAEKHFLYELVANKISGIDVDKWDYFLRDNQALHLGLTFDYKRFIIHSSLKLHEGKLRLAIEDKEASNIKNMFEDRARLHQHGYQHEAVLKLDRMICDLLLKADKFLNICYDREGKHVMMSEACKDMFVYHQLSDQYLFNTIQFSRDDNLAEARDLIKRIIERKLYKIIGRVSAKDGANMSDRMEQLQASLKEKIEEEGRLLTPSDMCIKLKRISSGFGRKNPVEKVLFINPKGKCKRYGINHLQSMMHINEQTLLVMLKRQGQDLQREAVTLINSWFQDNFNQSFDVSMNMETLGREI